jgi:6-pyruvoyltetrahydropterin/6-carboxytetrahydropterin synthase
MEYLVHETVDAVWRTTTSPRTSNQERKKEMTETAKTHNVQPGQPHVWVWKRCSFDAAHCLPNYVGPCSRMHGHTYFVELGVLCSIDPISGMGIDLRELGDFLKTNVVSLFDHDIVNDKLPPRLAPLVNPMYTQSVPSPSTAEGIARYILSVADRYFSKSQVKVRVYETPDSWVEMSSDTGLL